MDTNTEYKIVEGSKEHFEKESNRLAKEGWIWCGGSVSMIQTEKGIHYAQLMSKYTAPTQ